MSYLVSEFGHTKDNKKVSLYTLKNEKGLEASFIDLGAVWVSMKTLDKDNKKADIVLGYDTVSKYELNPPHFGAVIGRCANRISRGKFSLEGKEYQLQINNEVNSLHSGPDYFELRMWEGRAYEEDNVSKVEFKLHSPDKDQGFDGNADIKVVYSLTEDSLRIDYEKTCDKTTICNLTNHAYFNLAGHDTKDISEQEIFINADSFLPADLFSIPTREIEDVTNTPMDFREFTKIGKGINSDYECILQGEGYDHNWVIKDYTGKLKLIAKARDPKSKRLMEVYSDLPGVQFYTGNFLKSELEGKDNADYPRRSGYCLETQFFPNAINTPKFIQPILKAGEVFKSTTKFKFGISE